ncbi:MAG: Gfo/Idh/MocA family oxidoreductase, partial [Clostridiales bacterium]|nr:Gfo/Idh/MocA family oxidoreductase [Clostridiales bacterium]
MSKVRIAIIGCGMIANRHHIPCYKVNEDVELVYFCDIIREKAEKSAAEYGSGKVVEDYKEVLADPTVDAVDICTPNLMHSVIAIDAMKAGKHVLCEKPAAINYDEALKMQQVCHETGKVLNIGVVNRFEGHINMIRKYIQEGRLGEV